MSAPFEAILLGRAQQISGSGAAESRVLHSHQTMPTISRKEVLMNMSFGQRIAEEEEKELAKYFVETEQWRQISGGLVDIVYGPKGSGKSALYALLQDKAADFFDKRILMISGENPRGTTVFSGLISDPPTNEVEFVNLWKLYFLSLVASVIREYIPGSDDGKRVVSALESAGLISGQSGLSGLLRAVVRYLRRPVDSLQGELGFDGSSGLPTFTGKIVFRDPEPAEQRAGLVSVDLLFDAAQSVFARAGATIWILLDRLDVAFAESEALEANALRALFKVYLDLSSRPNIQLKIFLRSDIWKRIMSDQGFREASHITKHTTIKWDKPSLMNLILRRAIQSPQVLTFTGMTAEQALTEKQAQMMERLFPDQVDGGSNRSKTMDWILNRISDGTGLSAPRELIHFLNTTREEEMRYIELGTAEADDTTLFTRQAIKSALPEVSRVRLEQTIYAEYPDLRPFIGNLEREKSTQRVESLAKIWHVSEKEASEIAEKLTDIGFFEKTGEKDSPLYKVPFLYRPALDLVQGSAD